MDVWIYAFHLYIGIIMHKKIILSLVILMLAGVFSRAFAEIIDSGGDLNVTVTNIKNNVGSIRIALFNTNESYRRSGEDGTGAFKIASLKIESGGVAHVTFKHISYGLYGIKIFQDEDNSGVMKSDWRGRPTEDVGFSNNIDASDGFPDFEPVRFKVSESQTTQVIVMQRTKVK